MRAYSALIYQVYLFIRQRYTDILPGWLQPLFTAYFTQPLSVKTSVTQSLRTWERYPSGLQKKPSQQFAVYLLPRVRRKNSLPASIKAHPWLKNYRFGTKTGGHHLSNKLGGFSQWCYHPRLRFELLFWHIMVRYKCRLHIVLTNLLNGCAMMTVMSQYYCSALWQEFSAMKQYRIHSGLKHRGRGPRPCHAEGARGGWQTDRQTRRRIIKRCSRLLPVLPDTVFSIRILTRKRKRRVKLKLAWKFLRSRVT